MPVVAFRNRKDLALLVYLAHTGKAQQRDFLADLLWDLSSPRQASKNLRSAIARLRKQFAGVLTVTRQTVMIAPGSSNQVDSVQLLAAVSKIRTLDSAENANILQHALNSASDEFLTGFELDGASRFNEWVTATRAHIDQHILAAYKKLGDYVADSGDIDRTIAIAQRWLATDVTEEAAHMLLIRSLLAEGNDADALAAYGRAVEILRSKLSVEPSAKLRALVDKIKAPPSPKPHVLEAAQKPFTFSQEMHRTRAAVHNLPAEYDQFFGRKSIQQQIHERLDQPWCRLVTIVGQGGAGKTRLSHTIARHRLSHYPDGAWFVGLADIDPNDDDLAEAIAVEIATALDMRLKGTDKPLKQVLAYLKHRKMLLILDNLEHVLDGVQIVIDIVERCESVQLLATTREALGLRAEWTFDLAGLPYPASDQDDAQSDAVDLFLTRQAQRQGEGVSAENLAAIRTICHMVEGLPLAIELASAQTRHTPVQTIVKQLQDGLGGLTTLLRDVPLRHRSLYVVFEMSWQALSPTLQGQLARLSVFRSGFTSAAAKEIAAANAQNIHALADKSLLFHDVAENRYALHAVVRELAADKLAANDNTLEKHAHYYLALLAQQTEPLQKETPQIAINILRPDIDNIRLAWQVGLLERKVEQLEKALTSLSFFYQLRGLAKEAEATMVSTLENANRWGQVGFGLVVRASLERARFQNRLGQFPLAIQTVKNALRLANQIEDSWAIGMGHVIWGEALWRRGEIDSAENKLRIALGIAEESQCIDLIGWANHHLGVTYDIRSNPEQALEHLNKAVEAWKKLQSRQLLANSLNSICIVCWQKGDIDLAQAAAESAYELSLAVDDRFRQASILNNLSLLETERSNFESSLLYLKAGLKLANEMGSQSDLAGLFHNIGRTYLLMGNAHLANEHLTKSLKLAQIIKRIDVEVNSYNQLAQLAIGAGDIETARGFFQTALNLTQDHQLPRGRFDSLVGLAELIGSKDLRHSQMLWGDAKLIAENLNDENLLAKVQRF